jgi:hypothetical protein
VRFGLMGQGAYSSSHSIDKRCGSAEYVNPTRAQVVHIGLLAVAKKRTSAI